MNYVPDYNGVNRIYKNLGTPFVLLYTFIFYCQVTQIEQKLENLYHFLFFTIIFCYIIYSNEI